MYMCKRVYMCLFVCLFVCLCVKNGFMISFRGELLLLMFMFRYISMCVNVYKCVCEKGLVIPFRGSS